MITTSLSATPKSCSRWPATGSPADPARTNSPPRSSSPNTYPTASPPTTSTPSPHRWRPDITDWNICDWYATKALHAFLTADPLTLRARAHAIAAWSATDALWQRRASVVAFVKLAARGEDNFAGFTQLVLDACTANLVSGDRFAHTGPGWVLRELSRADPDAVTRFVDQHPHLSSEARRMATARLRDGPYRRR